MNKPRGFRILFALLVATILATGTVYGQPEDKDGGKPWAQGVSKADQDTARKLFREGNGLLKDSLFVKAAQKYREAVAHWDHPAIHYNLVLALLNLDQPIEVFHSIERAIRFQQAPLGQDKFDHAMRYKKLTEKQLAWVEISCDVPGAKVSLDGKEIFVGPGRQEAMVRIGSHTFTARKPGLITASESLLLGPAEKSKIELKLFTVAELTRYRRKWATWKPMAVVGGGAAVTILGGIFHVMARSNFHSYDDGIVACGGCVPDSGLAGKKDSAEWQQTAAIVSYTVGGLAMAAGATLVYMNRARAYRVDVQDKSSKTLPPPVAVVPMLGPGTVGLSTAFRF